MPGNGPTSSSVKSSLGSWVNLVSSWAGFEFCCSRCIQCTITFKYSSSGLLLPWAWGDTKSFSMFIFHFHNHFTYMGHNGDLSLHSAADNFCYYPPWPLGTVGFPKPGVWLKAFVSYNGSENGHILCLCTTKGAHLDILLWFQSFLWAPGGGLWKRVLEWI